VHGYGCERRPTTAAVIAAAAAGVCPREKAPGGAGGRYAVQERRGSGGRRVGQRYPRTVRRTAPKSATWGASRA
jgi:hypothetical protein